MRGKRCASPRRRGVPWPGSGHDELFHRTERSLRQCLQFGIRAVLNGMRHIEAVGMETERRALCIGGGPKHLRSDKTSGNTATIQFSYVMQTARRTGASVG